MDAAKGLTLETFRERKLLLPPTFEFSEWMFLNWFSVWKVWTHYGLDIFNFVWGVVVTQPSTGLQSKWTMSRRCSGISVTGTGSGEWGGEAVCATKVTPLTGLRSVGRSTLGHFRPKRARHTVITTTLYGQTFGPPSISLSVSWLNK